MVNRGHPTAQNNAKHANECTCTDNNQADQNIGLKVLFHISEKPWSCDKADRGYKENQAEIFYNLKRLFCKGYSVDITDNKLFFKNREQKCTKQQCNNEHACRAEIHSLNGYSAKHVAKS